MNCFYRKWGFTEGLHQGYSLEKVLECPSAAGILSGVRSGLGIALINGIHVTADIEVIEGLFEPPPDITFVARTNPKSRSAAIRTLVAEIVREFSVPMPLKAAE
jgi:DNA-binding transcriptional LysR family regulator